jgi:hypothetical protein
VTTFELGGLDALDESGPPIDELVIESAIGGEGDAGGEVPFALEVEIEGEVKRIGGVFVERAVELEDGLCLLEDGLDIALVEQGKIVDLLDSDFGD